MNRAVCRGEHQQLALAACLSSTAAHGRLEGTWWSGKASISPMQTSAKTSEKDSKAALTLLEHSFHAPYRSGLDIRFHFKSWIIITTRKITATNSREKT